MIDRALEMARRCEIDDVIENVGLYVCDHLKVYVLQVNQSI